VLEGLGKRDAWQGDRGMTHGYGVFETMLVVDSRIVSARGHFARMREGCERLGIGAPDFERVVAAIGKGLRQLDLEEGRARVRLTRTGGRGRLDQGAGEDEATLLTIGPQAPPPESLRALVSPWTRNETSALAGVKCLSYAENLVALAEARLQGADEAIFGNGRGELCEAATANVFLVEDGVLSTPELDSGCLPGTARERVLRLARGLGVEVVEGALQLFRLDLAEEIFLTSATRGVVPLAALGSRVLAAPGPVTAALRRAFDESLPKG